MKHLGVVGTLIVFLSLGTPLSLYAVERAPRMSDRELIEALAELKAGQQVLMQRFEQVDKRFEELRADMNARFEQVDTRLDQMITLFLGIIAAFVAIVAVTIGFAIWDRRTALRPALDRTERVEGVLKTYAREEPRLAEILKSVGLL